MKNELRKFFTKEAVVNSLQRLPELKTPVLDFLYPDSARINHNQPTVGWETLGVSPGNSYMTRNGSPSINVVLEGSSIHLINPQSTGYHSIITAEEANYLKTMTGQSIQQMIDERIDSIRKVIRKTTEALCAQVLTGKISYPMKSEGGANLSYEVDYGKIANVSVSKKWDSAETSVKQITLGIVEMKSAMKKMGYGTNVVFLTGMDVFSALIDKAAKINNESLIKVEEDKVTVGGSVIRLLEAYYTDLNTGNLVSSIPEKTVVAIDMAAGHKLIYASISDISADFKGLPFLYKLIEMEDPSGYKIIGTSKPLPCVNVKGIVNARVLA